VNNVIEACHSGRAFSFSAPTGWVVLQPMIIGAVPVLWVLAAYSSGGNAINTYQPSIIALAKRVGLSVIRFSSKRPGYRRVMPKLGWQLLEDGETWELNFG
jgi:GR25 family glycosyltransferase involved in LPS biosynthesis